MLARLVVGERGAMVAIAAATLVVACGMVALSVDVGRFLFQRRWAQNTADAAALAGALQLPLYPAQATADAQTWAGRNGATGGELTVEVRTTDFANDTIFTRANRLVPFLFAPVLGTNSASTSAQTKVVARSFVGGYGLLPWGVITASNPCFSGGRPIFGSSCSMRMGNVSGGTFDGHFGAVQLYNPGGDEYRMRIATGSIATYLIGVSVEPETGNVQGPTVQGLDQRLAREPTSGCGDSSGVDTFSEVFSAGPAGFYRVDCPGSPRVLIMPIVDRLTALGQSGILDFVLMYLDGYTAAAGQITLQVRPLAVNFRSSSGVDGPYRENGIRIIKLVE